MRVAGIAEADGATGVLRLDGVSTITHTQMRGATVDGADLAITDDLRLVRRER